MDLHDFKDVAENYLKDLSSAAKYNSNLIWI